MGRKTIEQQISHTYHDKIAFGESRHLAKQKLREENGDEYRFSMTDDKIHSIETFKTYSKVGREYASWLTTIKGISKYSKLEKTEDLAKEYLEYRLELGRSIWTVKMERSALGKLYGKTIEMEMPARNRDDVKRSRNECEHDKHFSKEKHKDEILVASACGTRREDLGKITINSFIEREEMLFVKIEGSKGGRDRIATVLPSREQEIKDLLERMKQEGKEKDVPLFDSVPKNMDVHSFRRIYAKSLMDYVEHNPEGKEIILRQYPKRREYKSVINKETGEKELREIKSEYFRPRNVEEKVCYRRDCLYAVSQGLGHNRIDVTYNSYLK